MARATSSFPVPVGPHDQHIGVMPRDLAGEVKYLQHGRTLADNAVKFQVFQ
jgi:hypothetical protein